MEKGFYEAARAGKVDVIGRCTVIELTPNKNTLLHVAAKFSRHMVVPKILEKWLWLVFSTNNNGDTALHVAAREGYPRVVKALLDCVKTSDQPPERRDVAINWLLSAVNEDGNTALHLAVGWGRGSEIRRRSEMVKMLVEEDRGFQYRPNKAQETPLYMATENENVEMVSEISNCRLPAFGGPGGRTALHAAALFSTDCLKFLLEKEDFVHLTRVGDDYGWTPLHYASHSGLTRSVGLLLEKDKSAAYVAAEKDNNNTPLLLAATAENVEVMEKLLWECPDCWEMVNKKGQNILHIALEMEHEEVIDFIGKKYDISRFLLNQEDGKGDRPLHLIARHKIEGANRRRLWLHSEADTRAFNNYNMTPADVARIAGREDSIPYRFPRRRYFGGRNIITIDRPNIMERKLSRRIKEEKAKQEAKVSKFEKIEKMHETLLLVVALIATVTFAAGFTLPGGFDGNEGPNQGLAILVKKMSFKVFIITNTVAVMSSISSIFLHFTATMRYDSKDNKYERRQRAVFYLAILAVIAMTIAFITGGSAVLAHSPSLAISMCVIGCFPFFMYAWDFRRDFVALAKYLWSILDSLADFILHPKDVCRWTILPWVRTWGEKIGELCE
ncbi:hypothetical protein NMG60_11025456 [Bertholletia excelsa]